MMDEPYEFQCEECRARDRFYVLKDGTKQCAACGARDAPAAAAAPIRPVALFAFGIEGSGSLMDGTPVVYFGKYDAAHYAEVASDGTLTLFRWDSFGELCQVRLVPRR
jgi:hypothetical protein